MASSRKHERLIDHVAARLTGQVRPGQHLALALSGGVDSVVLFDILRQLRSPLKFSLSALHVNHQISPHAPDWGRFCAGLCARHAVAYAEEAVVLERGGGDSLEALARAARYRAFAGLNTDFVVLAQHRDDQAETVLLQLLRGAGVKGLSAMPGVRALGESRHVLRPLLDVPRAQILAWAGEHDLAWVEDESNQDVRYDRNFLRHEVLPLLARRFPACAHTLARAGGHFAETAELLDQLAVLDACDGICENRLRVDVLAPLSAARARNLLRHFLDRQGIPMPSAARLDDVLHQVSAARPDARVHIALGEYELRRYRGELHATRRLAPHEPELSLPWQSGEMLVLPHGSLRFEQRQGEGVSLARLESAPLTMRYRRGGERLRPLCGRPSRSLKNLLQESAVPPWRRERLPLLYCGDALVCVPEMGVDCAWQAQPGEQGVFAIYQAYV